jgi:pilus assembly protein CpaE
MTAELPSVRNTVRYIEHLSKLGYAASSIYVVLNRYSKKGPLSDERIEKTLGRQISLRIPNSYNEVVRAINSGAPISSGSKSEFSVAIQKWARELTAGGSANAKDKAMAATAQPRGGMRALFGL